MNRTYRATFTVTVEVTVPEEAITRVLENEDDWRGVFYNLRDEEAVVEMIAWNCGVRGAYLHQLDGWADLKNAKFGDGCGRTIAREMDDWERIDAGAKEEGK